MDIRSVGHCGHVAGMLGKSASSLDKTLNRNLLQYCECTIQKPDIRQPFCTRENLSLHHFLKCDPYNNGRFGLFDSWENCQIAWFCSFLISGFYQFLLYQINQHLMSKYRGKSEASCREKEHSPDAAMKLIFVPKCERERERERAERERVTLNRRRSRERTFHFSGDTFSRGIIARIWCSRFRGSIQLT